MKGSDPVSPNEQLDLRAIVVEKFQRHSGAEQALPIESRLLEELGIDSIAFVTILMDLTDQLDLDLAAARVKLKHIRTLADVVALVESLRADAVRAA